MENNVKGFVLIDELSPESAASLGFKELYKSFSSLFSCLALDFTVVVLSVCHFWPQQAAVFHVHCNR